MTSEKQTPSSEHHKNLDEDFAQWIKAVLNENHILGASIAVVDNGIVESAGYGLARLPDTRCTPDTIFRMASTSKAIGAAVMGLILRDETVNTMAVDGRNEKLAWSTPIKKILGGDFMLNDEYVTNNVTIEDSLSNRAGTGGHDFNYGPWMGRDTATLTRSLRYLDLVTGPLRSAFQYNNTMFAVIGHVIEEIDTKPFDEAARERLWKPLGMKNTFATLEALSTANASNEEVSLARGYWWAEDDATSTNPHTDGQAQSPGGYYLAEAHLDLDLIGPAAAVLSTANDYIKWIQALIEAAQPSSNSSQVDTQPGNKIISQDLFNDLTTARSIIVPPFHTGRTGNNLMKYFHINPQLYSLGWFTDPYTYDGETVLHHPGGCQGFGSHVFLLPERKFGLVVMENGGGANSKIAELVGREIIGRKLGVVQGERRSKGELSDSIEEIGVLSSRDAELQVESVTIQPTTGTTNLDAADMTGAYNHPAFGTIHISLAPSASIVSKTPTLEGIRLIRHKHHTDEPQIDIDVPPLHFSFEGTRSFLGVFLLHKQPQPSPQPRIPSSSQADPVFFTVESLWPHGTLQSDPIPNLPPGLGHADDPAHPFRHEGVYDSTSFWRWGAAFEHGRLGIVLGRTEMDEASQAKTLTNDWRRKLVWFERV